MSDKAISPNLNFLLVDDDPRILKPLRQTLEAAGFKNLHTAENGKEALHCLRKYGIDLVFLDWDMPEMNGDEVLETMQAEKMLTYTKVVMLTGHSEKDYVVASKQLGATNYIIKPFTPISVYEKLESIFCADLPFKNDIVFL